MLFHATTRSSAMLLTVLFAAVWIPSLHAGENGKKMSFASIPPGRCGLGINVRDLQGAEKNMTFIPEDEGFRYAEITRGLLVKDTEVTWTQWNDVLSKAGNFGYKDIGTGRNGFRGDDEGEHPVTEVSWWDAVKWCNLLSEIENLKPCYYTGETFNRESVLRAGGGDDAIHVDWNASGYRLPTEAEWEYAWNHAGQHGFQEPDGWHRDLSEGNTHPVRSRPSGSSNGLHDMLGNVAEWCWDWKGPVTVFKKDPRGPETGTHRVFRGGSWADHWMCCRGPYRGDFSPNTPRSIFIGFRPVRLSNK